MNVEVAMIDQALTGNGTAQGGITVGSTTGILPGAFGQLYDTAGHQMAVQVVQVVDGTHLTLRKSAQPQSGPQNNGAQAAGTTAGNGSTLTQNLPPNYGFTDVSAFTTVNGSRFCQNAGIVRVEPQSQAAPLL